MLYTSSVAKSENQKNMKQYFILPNHGNDQVLPDKSDLDLFSKGVMTEKGFALNYETKLRGQKAYDWMSKVSTVARHEDVLLVGGEEETSKIFRKILAEMITSMFGGSMNFQYAGELK